MVQVSDHILMAGDWHGDTDWAVRSVFIAKAKGIDAILHVGDFGIGPGDWGKKFLDTVTEKAGKAGVTIVVTPGNHEDWDRLDNLRDTDTGDGWGAVKHLTDRIIVLPRAHRVNLEYSEGSRSLVSLGGAPSIDFPHRTEGRSWWKSEMITLDDVERTIAGGHADIMVAHDSPGAPWASQSVSDIIYDPNAGMYWSEAGLNYAAEGRKLMHMAYEGVMPKMFFHGHFHVFGRKVHEHGEVWSLNMQREPGNLAVLDLETLSVIE